GEIDVARRVDDVDPVVVPEAGRRRRRNGDPALLLLLHPVHGGGALMDLADLVGPAGVIQDSLGRRRLPGIDVGHDADVAISIEGRGAGHETNSLGYGNRPTTSGNGRRPCWPPPYDGCLPASSPRIP